MRRGVEIALLVYAGALIVLGAMGYVVVAAIVGIVGFLLMIVYSACWVSGECAQYEEDEYGIRRS